MRWKQHEKKCEVCGNTYLFYKNGPGDAVIPDLTVFGDHPTRCPNCVDAPDKVPSPENEIRADLDAKKEEVLEGVTPGGETVKGYHDRSLLDEFEPNEEANEKLGPGTGRYSPSDEGEL